MVRTTYLFSFKDNQPEASSPPAVHHGVTSPMSFGSNPSSFSSGNKAQGSMKLGQSKPKASGKI